MRLLLTISVLLISSAAGAAEPLAPQDAAFFDEKVRPLLEKRCYECHSHQSGKMRGALNLDSRSGWAEGGGRGPAIIPGDLGKSLLITAIRRTDKELKMPPKEPLAAAETAILEEWVRRGAPDPRAGPGGAPDSEWWSLKPLVRPKLPEGSEHPLDLFIEARLRQESIQPAPEADRRTLIRRLTFDLHGLPPTPEEVACFVNDSGSGAYERLTDRLLASPRYGERWARHWLDTIHYADTHGFEHDLMRTNAWRYRDYVIESLNRDIPWARFIREQLAADHFFPEEPRLTAALGFIGAGPWDQSTAQTAPKTFEYLDRDDIVTQTMSAFSSVTAHCARCHNHKFDPISQEDYYALQAVFAGVGKGNLLFDEDARQHQKRQHWKQLLAAAERQDASVLLRAEQETLAADWEASRGAGAKWEVLRPEIFLTAGAAVLKRGDDGSFLAEGARPETDTYTLSSSPALGEITAVRLEVLSDSELPMKGPGRQDNGNFHLSEFELRLFPPDAVKGEKLAIARATADFNQSGWTISAAIDGNEKTAWGIFPRTGESHTAVFELARKLVLTNGSRLVFQIKQLHGQGHLIGKFRLSVTADPPVSAEAIPFTVAEARQVPRAQRTEAQRLAVAAWAIRALAEETLAAMPPPAQVFGAGPDFVAVAEGGFYKPWREPKQVHLLTRGEISKPRGEVPPGALSAIARLPGRFELDPSAKESARRAALADWLADPHNPLTWRSIVNRVWHYHFGRGLSDSPNDLGRMGSLPSHPELLDWLACEFRDTGGSLKRLHRLIVTSAAYRRASLHDEAAFARDPDNRLLWRGQRQRLDAESFRDSVFAVTGRLNLTMGGPGVHHFKLGKPIQLTPTVEYADYDWDRPEASRRSIYRFIYRGLPDPFMDALDFPDAAQLAPTRPFSASALQALALLNNDFVLHHSRHFAARLEQQGAGLEERVEAAFQLAFQRLPDQAERAEFAAYAEKHGLAAMCRVILNSNEFLFIN